MNKDCLSDIEKRLATVEGHVKAVRKMVADNKDCVDVITQLLAIERSVKKAGVILLKNHLNNCVKETAGDNQKVIKEIADVSELLQLYL